MLTPKVLSFTGTEIFTEQTGTATKTTDTPANDRRPLVRRFHTFPCKRLSVLSNSRNDCRKRNPAHALQYINPYPWLPPGGAGVGPAEPSRAPLEPPLAGPAAAQLGYGPIKGSHTSSLSRLDVTTATRSKWAQSSRDHCFVAIKTHPTRATSIRAPPTWLTGPQTRWGRSSGPQPIHNRYTHASRVQCGLVTRTALAPAPDPSTAAITIQISPARHH